ncbi:HAD-IIA family hydrolase [Clostridium saccharoperbutylacetonicum]|uniref:HAD-IIA family hydrolase n=1 Tax=Clostridium saccharoperbutylacetonicum TaxID=36745 RepID=UPI000983B2E2|nr:HAD-IIA family hydrolase [Clostridium saccharoperbutylacetonicum]AQR96647.1 putative hydrolase YutF [Clostridium saccharoperbutylacetonicum]NSB32523.1 HAD superfamily hydrolase (TIGR01450 family) [Clostridium saccharoperbutylacetonicum]
MLKDKKLFLLDIDGTIALDTTLIDGTLEFMEHVLSIGGKYIFITNNSTTSIDDYIKKFEKFKIKVDATSFVTSSYATALYLKENYKDKKIFVLGTKSFIQELKSFDIKVTEEQEDDISCAVVGFDNELNYKKIEDICELLTTRNIDYIATNPDLVCPTSFGFIPDCGSICQMIGNAVKREPIYIGKPNKAIVEMCLKQTGYSKEETLVIGDRLYTDIACGINGGVDTAVLFTGEAKKEDLADTEFKPTYSFESIKELYEELSI